MIAGLREGDLQIQLEFWMQYGLVLERIAAKNRRLFGPEDVAQAVCRTFFRRSQGGEQQRTKSEALWSLLCAITLTKLQQKRRLEPLVPFAADATEFSAIMETVLASLDDVERQLVELKLQDFTDEEVASQMGGSERTVGLLLKRVQGRLEKSANAR